MSSSEAVAQAIALLRNRRAELNSELTEIDNALRALGVTVGKSPTERVAVTVTPPIKRDSLRGTDAGPSVRGAVLDLLEAEPIRLTNAEVVAGVRRAQGDRPDDQFKSNVRSSLWSLKRRKFIRQVDGRYVASKWLTDAEAAPVSAEAASDSIRSDTEGGDADGAVSNRVHDPHSSTQAINHDHGSGAAMTGG